MTRTMKELADFLGCPVEGDGAATVSGVASTMSARAEDLIYVESPRHLGRAAASASVSYTHLTLPTNREV